MGEFYTENLGFKTHLVYAIGRDDVIDKTSLDMMNNNSIPSFLPSTYMQMNEDRFIKYDITSRITARQYMEGTVRKEQVLSLLESVLNALTDAEEYMIDDRTILLDLDKIYVDLAANSILLICLPVERENERTDLESFLRDLVANLRFDENEDGSYILKLMNYLNEKKDADVPSLRALVQTLRQTGKGKPLGTVPSAQSPASGHGPVAAPPQSPRETPPHTPAGAAQKQTPPAQPPVVKPPVAQPPVVTPPPAKPPAGKSGGNGNAGSGEKDVSFLYLLRHMDKETLERYRAGKEAKNSGKAAPAAASAKAEKRKQAPKAKPAAPGFAIPGQDSPAVVPSTSVKTPEAPRVPVYTPGGNKAAAPVPAAPPISTPAPVSTPRPGGRSQPLPTEVDLPDPYEEDEGDGGTVIMDFPFPDKAESYEKAPYLYHESDGKRVRINKAVFRIGRDERYNDFVIANRYIGHSHCHILLRDGTYYLVDDNSKNHTYVDGQQIASGQETPLKNKTRITIANDDYVFLE